MRRALLRINAVGWALGLAVVGLAPMVARADAPTEQGWWTVANPGGLPLSPADATAADVPADGLLVQSGPINPTSPCNCTALAAVIYELKDGTTATDFTLKVAPNSGTTPVATLELCPLVNAGLHSEQGGPLGDAPDYDCKHHESAALGAGDSSFTFHVGSLVSDGILAVAIIPGDSTSRVVLSKPNSSSLATTESTSSGPAFPAPSISAPSTTDSGSAPVTGGAAAQQPSVPSLPQQSSVGGSDPGQTPVIAPSPAATAVATTPVAATSSTDKGSTPIAILIIVAGIAVASALWAVAGRGPGQGIAES
jgi:hypothetical protein